ncbi:MAG TPA: hypothetical protein QGH92_00870 [Candidatus Parcubacteria bacterium]|jgi:hypothetical protein|nr:hypothetical protein [Candidatus Parcubacteria bacterium]|tara:strand:+ start:500 stop:724 length:225 start_codon:yes stop_codon:yes gene_type:complete
MLSRLRQFIKEHQEEIILFIGVILISLLSFAAGFIAAKSEEKQPIRIEKNQNEKHQSSHYWSGDMRIVSRLEAF